MMRSITKYNQWSLLIITVICGLLFYHQPTTATAVCYPLISLLCLSGLLLPVSFNPGWIPLFIASGLSIWQANFSFFLPVVCLFTLQWTKFPRKYCLIIISIPLIWHFNWTSSLLWGLIFITFILNYCSQLIQQLYQDNLKLQDDSFEQQKRLKQQNTALKSANQTQLQLQIANERNKIARDIHDNVGHLLSSSLLQVAALQTLNQNEQSKPSLLNLEQTLNQALDSIRLNVHQLQHKALSFPQEFELLCRNFQFCSLECHGQPFVLNSQQQANVILIIKEALTNIMKHSQATLVQFNFQKLPAFNRLQIINNGASANYQSGMGLMDMTQRAQELNGQIHFHTKADQFLVTLIIPKGGLTDAQGNRH